MQLLFLTSRLPYPPNRGDRLRVFNFIRTLAGLHEIHLVSFIAGETERQNIEPLRKFCQTVQVVPLSSIQSALRVGVNLWRKQPLQTLYYRSGAMQELVDRTLAQANFDIIFVHLFRMAPYVTPYKNIYRVVDLTDVISQELMRSIPYRGWLSKLIYALELPRIEHYEHWVANHFEETWLISEHDRNLLAADCPKANIQVVRNGVDVESFHPTNEAEVPHSLILVGHMGVFHNVDAAIYLVKEILPRVWKEFPNTTVKLVGAEPNRDVHTLSRIPRVKVTGFVPDLNAILNQTTVFVAPLRFAAGVQNKVLEAMAAGRPVVTSSLVNEGIMAQPERDLLIADSPEESAAAIIRLFHDAEFRLRLGKSAREFVKRNYRWDFAVERLRAIQGQKRNFRDKF